MTGVRANSSLQWWKHLTADLDSAVDLRRAYDVTYVCGWRGCQHASLCVVLITLWSWTSILCGASHNRNKKKNLWCISLVGPYSLLFFCVFFFSGGKHIYCSGFSTSLNIPSYSLQSFFKISLQELWTYYAEVMFLFSYWYTQKLRLKMHRRSRK